MAKSTKKAVKKSAIIAAAAILITAILLGGTIAYLAVKTNVLQNIFNPSEVVGVLEETTENGVKTNVYVSNPAGEKRIDFYVRAAIIVNWKNSAGEVCGRTPVEETDYNITLPDSPDWFEKDGYYYYKYVVPVGSSTLQVSQTKANSQDSNAGYLILSCAPVAGKAPDGFSLSVEIVTQEIQALPARAVTAAWNNVRVNDDTAELEPVTNP